MCLQVYDLIDRSSGFYTNNVQSEYRSHTALPFRYAFATLQQGAQLLGSLCCMACSTSYINDKQTPHKLCLSMLVSVDALLGVFGSDIKAWQISCALHMS